MEDDIFPQVIHRYKLYDTNNAPVSLSTLPLLWSSRTKPAPSCRSLVCLKGFVADGPTGERESLHLVKAWKYASKHSKSGDVPELELYVLAYDWIQLKNPSEHYKSFHTSLLVVLHCLYFLKTHHQASLTSLLEYLSSVFSSDDATPLRRSADITPYLKEHADFIREATRSDKTLAKSKVLASLCEIPVKMNCSKEVEEANEFHKKFLLVAEQQLLQQQEVLRQTQPLWVLVNRIMNMHAQDETERSNLVNQNYILGDLSDLLQMQQHSEMRRLVIDDERRRHQHRFYSTLHTNLGEQMERMVQELKPEPSFKVRYYERINLILGYALPTWAGLVAAMIALARLPKSKLSLWISSAFMYFLMLSSQYLLTIYHEAKENPMRRWYFRMIRTLCYISAVAAPSLLYTTVFMSGSARVVFRVLLAVACVLCFRHFMMKKQ